jgi:fluoride exporter
MSEAELPRILGVVALGGVIGSLARYGLAEAIPHGPGEFPWATFVTNVLGCFAIGVLLARITPRSHPLLRPFLGTGILGGFTTFSTFTYETFALLQDGEWLRAFANVAGQVVCGLVALWAGYAAVGAL